MTTRRELLVAGAGLALFGGKSAGIARSMGYKSMRLGAPNIEELGEFYGSKLNLPVSREGKNLRIQAGGTEFLFEPAEGKSVYHFAFNIPENKLEEAQDWLRKRTALVMRNGSPTFHFQNWNAHATYFFDPAGNIVEFIARHSLPNTSRSLFDEKSVLYASELGLVVDDVSSTVRAVGGKLGMKPYRGSVSDEFAAIGDEHALLIVVKRGRVWFGTEALKAATHPAEAHIAGLKGSFAEWPYVVGG